MLLLHGETLGTTYCTNPASFSNIMSLIQRVQFLVRNAELWGIMIGQKVHVLIPCAIHLQITVPVSSITGSGECCQEMILHRYPLSNVPPASLPMARTLKAGPTLVTGLGWGSALPIARCSNHRPPDLKAS